MSYCSGRSPELRVENLGVWEGTDKRDALEKCLTQRNQTIAQRANLLGLSEDRYLNDYVDGKNLIAQVGFWPADDARQHARAWPSLACKG
jgi:hypothetical protein